MMRLDVRIDGFDQPVGHLTSDPRGAISFEYASAYVARPDALRLSVSFPLVTHSFDDYAARAYFDNLLQERDTARADIIAKYRLSNDDVVGILYHLGKDCAGAVSVLPENAPPTKVPGELEHDYEPYSDAQLKEIVTALYERRPLPNDLQDPSPLAGVQSKIAVAVLPDGRLAEPRHGAPTTHILKVPQQRHERDAEREHLAMSLSAQMDFPTASTAAMEISGIPVLLVERYDRRIEGGRVTRVHQEDFCQALGLPAQLKYQRPERRENHFNVDAVRTLLDQTIDPIAERLRFLEITLFDILVGNVDGHAKNFALFHLPGNRLMTTPRYDVMPTMLDRNTTDEFAYRIGPAQTLDDVDGAALDMFAGELGFVSAAGRKRIVAAALDKTLAVLNAKIEAIGKNDKNFADLIATNINTLCRNLGRGTPMPARDRDTFVR